MAAEIARIEEIHDLRQQAAMLKQQLAQVLAAPAFGTVDHRSHNHPPELVDAPAEIRESLTIIWADLDAAEKELVKPSLSGAALRRIGTALVKSAAAVLAYCGKTLDTFAQSAVKAAGGVLGLAIAAALSAEAVLLLAKIGTFGEALLNLASRLLGG